MGLDFYGFYYGNVFYPVTVGPMKEMNIIVKDAFKKANKEFGATVVITLHDLAIEGHMSTTYVLEREALRGE